MSRLLAEPINGVLQALASLEKDGLVAARFAGRTRLCQLNPRYFALTELRAYLARLGEPETELRNRIKGPRDARAFQTDETLGKALYCLLYTIVLFTAWPLAFVPVWVMVMVLPSAETTTFAVTVGFPPFFQALL